MNRVSNIAKSGRNIAIALAAILVAGCSPLVHQSMTFESDDMYATHDTNKIADKKAKKAAAEQQLREERAEQWAAILNLQSEPQYELSTIDDSYNTPYGEKLLRLSAQEYVRPASYYQTLMALSEYDPSEYSASINEDGVIVVEPLYMSSMYGVWNTPMYYNNYWGYNYGYYDPWWGGYSHYPYYYGRWGYPYSYSPYSYYSPYYSSFYGPYYDPFFYRPIYRPATIRYEKRPRQIVKTTIQNSGGSSSSGNRQPNGATVGRTSGNSGSYNRSSTRSSSSYSSPSSSRTPSYSAPSASPSMPSSRPQTNSIGR